MQQKTEYIINIIGNANEKATQLNASVQHVDANVNKFRNSLASIRDAGLAFDAISRQADRLGGVFGSVFSSGMETELQKQNLTTLLGGNIDAADTLFAKISDYGKNTVYDKAGLIDAQKTMMSFGIEGEKAFSTLKNIGDISMGDANKMRSLSLAFSQTTSTGKLMGQDLLQMINAGFNPLQVISDKTGKSMSVLKDEMSKGAISADMISQAFQWATEEGALFYEGAEKAGSITYGTLNKLKDSITEISVELFNGLQPAINKVMGIVSASVSFISEYQTVILVVGSILAGLVVLIKSITFAMGAYNTILTIVTAATTAWAAIQTALNAIMNANPIYLIIAGIVALVGVIIWLCTKITGWGSLWEGVMGFMKFSFYAFIDGVKLYFTTWINGFLIGLDKVKIGWYKFKEACGLGDSTENQAAIAEINADVEKRQQAIVDGAKAVMENANKAKESLAGIKMGWGSGDDSKDTSSMGTQSQLLNAVSGGSSGMGGGSEGGSGLGKSSEAIATGGTRTTNITITLKNMVENINFNGSISEKKEEVERQLAEVMFRVLNMAQSSVG